MDQSLGNLTRILNSAGPGDSGVAEQLLPLVYDELRKLAAARMAGESPGHTLQPTALVHEAWLRVAINPNLHWNSRGHFFAAAAEAMRRILVDRARRKRALRHGGEQEHVPLQALSAEMEPAANEVLRIHEFLDELAALNARQAEVVKLRYFVGLKMNEIAVLQGVTEKTVQRDWNYAKAWLRRRMTTQG